MKLRLKHTSPVVLSILLLSLKTKAQDPGDGPINTFASAADWFTDETNPYIYMEATMIVPPVPDKQWLQLFIWPGLQPQSINRNFQPVGKGVLQPVLAYGITCISESMNLNFDPTATWWITPMYANTNHQPNCLSGDVMAVSPGESLRMILELVPSTTIWRQRVISLATGRTLTFNFDLGGQSQTMAVFAMETKTGWHANPPAWDVTDIILKVDTSTTSPLSFCRYDEIGYAAAEAPDRLMTCTPPRFSANQCQIDMCSFNKQNPLAFVQGASRGRIDLVPTASPSSNITLADKHRPSRGSRNISQNNLGATSFLVGMPIHDAVASVNGSTTTSVSPTPTSSIAVSPATAKPASATPSPSVTPKPNGSSRSAYDPTCLFFGSFAVVVLVSISPFLW